MAIGPKTRTVALWAFKILVGLLFAAAGAAKLAGAPMMVQEFQAIGLGQGFRYLTGMVEIGSVVLLLVPSTSRFGALGLVGICIGALVTQIAVLQGDLVHVFVLLAASGFLAWRGFVGARVR
jgi:putative oxidoreductase